VDVDLQYGLGDFGTALLYRKARLPNARLQHDAVLRAFNSGQIQSYREERAEGYRRLNQGPYRSSA